MKILHLLLWNYVVLLLLLLFPTKVLTVSTVFLESILLQRWHLKAYLNCQHQRNLSNQLVFHHLLFNKKSPALAVSFLIFKDLLLKTGGCLPKYLWASHYIMWACTPYLRDRPLLKFVGSKNYALTYYAGILSSLLDYLYINTFKIVLQMSFSF